MFSLKLLGGAALEGADGAVRGRASHRRRIAILALLASARGRAVARERLIGLLWPEHPGDAARHLLSESLYVLRKALGENAFVTVGDEVALDPRVVESDVGAFLEAVDGNDPACAVALYRGPFLDGFYLSGADEFERWTEVERDRLARAYAQALERLAEGAEGAGDLLAAGGWWRRLTEHDPYSSRVVLRLMRALESAGEHTAALRAATDHADFLRDDLGAQPDPAVPAYAERLRTTPPPGRIPPSLAPSPEPLSSPAAATATQEEPGPDTAPADAVAPGEPASPIAWPDGLPLHPPLPAPRPGRRRVYVGIAALLTAAVTAVGSLAILGAPPPEPDAVAGPVLDPRRVAVLYFDDHSEARDLAHIANGLTEGLIHELAQVSALDVISRNGVKPYRDGRVSVDSLAKALRVGTLVEGSIQRSGNRLRVTVQLVDAKTGAHLMSRALERPMGELFALEDELAREVAELLRRRLGPEIRLQERTAATHSLVAREAVFRAEQLRDEAARLTAGPNPLGSETAQRILSTADSLLAEAARADRRWAEPWILRGWVALKVGEHNAAATREEAFEAALRHAEQALELAPGDPGALELRGTVRWRRVQVGVYSVGAESRDLSTRALHDLTNALERDPSRARAWSTLSQLLRVQEGRLPEADVAARRALEEDEFLEEAPLIMERLYRSSVQLARYDSAAAWCARGRQRFPNDWRFVDCRLTLLGYPGPERADMDLAWHLFREVEQLDPPEAAKRVGREYWPTYRRMAVARVAARGGLADTARAISLAARTEVRGNRELEGAQAGDEAYVRLLLGERDSALTLLERHLAVQPRLRAQVARDIKFSPLRSDPRFRRLVAEAPERRY